MTEVKVLSTTPDGEKLILNIARVSTPSNRDSTDTRLLNYLITHKHWSTFEHAFITFEVNNLPLPIATQIMRHRSMSYQQHSQRYSESDNYVEIRARRQADKNRQSSVDDLDPTVVNWFNQVQKSVWEYSYGKYKEALAKGIAKECARFLLPENTSTTLIISGSIRSIIHYLQLRLQSDTQREHREVAEAMALLFREHYPIVYESANLIVQSEGSSATS